MSLYSTSGLTSTSLVVSLTFSVKSILSIVTVKPLEYEIVGGSRYGHGMMVSRWSEPKQNQPFIDFFGLDSSEDLPCFVTFIWGDDEELRSIVTSIEGNTVDEVNCSLKEIIITITDAESKISDENKSTENIFREVSQDLQAKKFRSDCLKFVKKIKEVKSFLDLLGIKLI